MSASIVPLASRTSLVTPTPSWHVGISPGFPSSLTLSNDSAIESLLTDIPFLSVGLLGFGVITFFFAMRRFNRLAFFTFASVIVAFIAGVLDVGQVLTRGEASTNSDSNVSSILPLLIARELALAVSISIRFLFFWTFVAKAPRGERPHNRVVSQKRQNFLKMNADVHSGSWARWGILGAFFNVTLLLAVIAIPVLQLIWRLVAQFSRFGPLYNADAALEIVVSALFILKLFSNAWLSPLTPRWKTIRDYSPVVAALLFGLGVGVGNIICFQFSETSLGRLLQAVELYILVLYVLISAFYHHRPRMSMVVAPKKSMSPFEGIQAGERLSSFQITPPSVSTPEPAEGLSQQSILPTMRPSNKHLSSWLVPDAGVNSERSGGPRRASTAGRLASWLTDRRVSGTEQSRLWNKDDMETGVSHVDEKTGYAASFDESPTSPRQTVWTDPVYTSVAPSTRERLEQITTALEALPPGFKGNGGSPNGTISSFNVENYGTDGLPSRSTRPPGSPVYGLEGIVRYHERSQLGRPESAQSSGMESLLRQQAELDKSVAELQMFSSSSRLSASTIAGKLSVPGGQPESFRSEISLSNFPAPPAGKSIDLSKDADPVSSVEDAPLTLRPPLMPAATTDTSRQQSFPSTTRWSDSSMLNEDTAGRMIAGSSGTQYDVTSFIGDLTIPTPKEFSQTDKLMPVVEQPILETTPVTTVVGSALKSGAQMQTPMVIAVGRANPASGLPAGPRLARQGLPRSKLNISGPIPRANVEKATAYERPRPVPAP